MVPRQGWDRYCEKPEPHHEKNFGLRTTYGIVSGVEQRRQSRVSRARPHLLESQFGHAAEEVAGRVSRKQ